MTWLIKKMKNNILLSIAIPTWNSAKTLESLLNNLLEQMKELPGEVEICISNNGSVDGTRTVVMNFKDKYPDLIKYNENEKNIGYDLNMLKAIGLTSGEFVWTFGDDDWLIPGGLHEVIALIKKIPVKETGLIFVRRQQYSFDKKNQKKMILYSTAEKEKPEVLVMDKKNIMGMHSPDPGFMSALILNGAILRGIMASDKLIIDRGVGIHYIHVILQSLIFLKFPHLAAISLNKVILSQELPLYKFFIESNFALDYVGEKRLNNLLLSCQYISDDYIPILMKGNRKLSKKFVVTMVKMRALESFNYNSYFGCIRSFFRHAPVLDALIFSFVFTALFLLPPAAAQLAYKSFLALKYGTNWRAKWIQAYNTTRGSRKWDFTSESR